MKSIRKKITVCLMATVLIALLAVGGTSIALNYRSTVATVDQMLSETAVLAAERVEQELTAYKNVAMDTGCIPQLSDATVSREEKQAIIDERDKLLQFVSHDMRKPLNSSVSLLDAVIEREKDTEQIKTLQIIRQNDLRVVANLSEIATYAKYNYVSEPSQVVDLSELCEDICRFYSFDCNANGIVLKNLVNRKYRVFVKTQGLESALSNIIMNAVEHANCSVITLSAKSVKNKVVLNIADNGKRISADMDVFKPYVSENKPDTGGIGLYICKNIIKLLPQKLRRHLHNPGHTHGVLRRQRRHRTHGIYTVAEHRLNVRLDSRAAARVTSGNR